MSSLPQKVPWFSVSNRFNSWFWTRARNDESIGWEGWEQQEWSWYAIVTFCFQRLIKETGCWACAEPPAARMAMQVTATTAAFQQQVRGEGRTNMLNYRLWGKGSVLDLYSIESGSSQKSWSGSRRPLNADPDSSYFFNYLKIPSI